MLPCRRPRTSRGCCRRPAPDPCDRATAPGCRRTRRSCRCSPTCGAQHPQADDGLRGRILRGGSGRPVDGPAEDASGHADRLPTAGEHPRAGRPRSRHVLDAADEVRAQHRRVAGHVHVGDAIEHLPEDEAQLHSCEVGAETEVRARHRRRRRARWGPGDVEAERLVETSSSRLAEMCHMTTLSPSLIACAVDLGVAVAVRRKCITGEAHRRISSTAVPSRPSMSAHARRTGRGSASAPTCPTRSCCGWSRCRRRSSSSMNMSNSSSVSCSPSISALISLVTMSSRGSLRRCFASSLAYGYSSTRSSPRRRRGVLGVVGADHPVRPLEHELRGPPGARP